MNQREFEQLLSQIETDAEQGLIKRALAKCARLNLCPPDSAEQKSRARTLHAKLLYQFREDRTDEALASAEMARRLNGKNDEAWEYKALLHWRKNERDEAIAAYIVAIKCCPLENLRRRSVLHFSCARVMLEAGCEYNAAIHRKKADELAARADAVNA